GGAALRLCASASRGPRQAAAPGARKRNPRIRRRGAPERGGLTWTSRSSGRTSRRLNRTATGCSSTGSGRAGSRGSGPRLDEWDRNLAPSNELRTWFGHDPARFDEFRRRYMVELEGQTERLRDLRRIAGQGRLTLVYAARDPEHNDAVVLADVLRRVETSFAGIGNTSDTMTPRPTVRALGVNHVALEVDSVDAALAWWGRFLSFELRGRRPTMAWIDLGDQFIALSEPRSQAADDSRHFGLVVDDKEALRAALRAADVDVP